MQHREMHTGIYENPHDEWKYSTGKEILYLQAAQNKLLLFKTILRSC